MAKINDTTTFPNTAPAAGDHFPGTDVSNTTNDAAGETVTFTMQAVMDLFEANMTVPSSVSSAYRTSTILSSTSNAEGAALIGVEDAGTYFAGATVEAVLAEIGALLPAEANADVTDTANVTAAGALMDSEVTNLAQVKAFDSSDYAAASHTHTASDVDAEASTDGFVLTSDGAGNAAWEAVPTGGAPEGTSVLSTGESVATFLRADGDNTSSWQTVTAAVVTIADAGGIITATTVEGALAENRTAIDAVEALMPSGTVVGTTDSQTLSGKTIAGATISSDLIPNADGTVYLGSPSFRYASLSVDTIDLNGTTIDGTALASPGTDRLVFWDQSADTTAWLTAGAGLTISDTTITVDDTAFVSITDLASTANGDGAALIGIEDAGTLITATTVEGALAEIATDVAALGAPEGTAVLSTGPVTDGYVLTADGAGGAAWEAQAGGGNVTAQGTPVDGYIGVWTSATGLEGDAGLQFDTTDDTLVIAASGKLAFGAVDVLSDNAGVTTLAQIDALDATTIATMETAMETAIDTLGNLTSIQGHTVTLTGNFIRSGAHSLTLTTGGATNVTLPTTGTLAAYGDTTANFTGTLQNGGSNVVVGTDIGSTVQAYDADTLKADTADQLTAGFTAATDDDSTAASPYTPDHDAGNYKRVINDGAMTINGPTMASGESTSMVILLTNTTGAGAITFGTTTDSGDTIGTTTTDEYLIFITAVDVGGTTYSHASVKALQ